MRFDKLKVRPKKARNIQPCAVELSNMLGCWAATTDVMSTSACATSAQALFSCMRNLPPMQKHRAPTINYHLARLTKNLK